MLYREIDNTYSIELPFGLLYAHKSEITKCMSPASPKEQSMELNVAYEALEKMRRLNLEVSCQELGIKCDYEKCTTCVLASPPEPSFDPRYPVLSSFKRLVDGKAPRSGSPCVLCGAPACNQHSSKTFRQQKITICKECEHLFTLDFVATFLSNAADRRNHLDRLIDAYDRALLLLKFSMQYVDDVVDALLKSKIRKNRVGLGSSATGMVSGVLGVAAAASILTPAGPPLLLASLLFGGGATVVQTGSDVHQYYMEPTRLAERILALHGIVHALLGVAATLRDALARDIVREDYYLDDKLGLASRQTDMVEPDSSLLVGMTAGRYTAAGIEFGTVLSATEAGTLAGRNARFFSKAGTGLGGAVRVVQVAGGALSAATLLLEAHSMTNTIQQMQAGNPCEKAESLKDVQAELPSLPATTAFDVECENYLKLINRRQREMTEDEAVKLLLARKEDVDSEDGTLILQEEDCEEPLGAPESKDIPRPSSSSMSSSLLERIELYKAQEQRSDVNTTEIPDSSSTDGMPPLTDGSESTGSLLERIRAYKDQ